MIRHHIRILLIEDDPDDVWVMRNMLSDRWDGSCEMIHAETLAVGLRHCAAGKFDVILLDLALPDSFGIETFLTAHSHAVDVPIVVLTGEENETLGMKAVQAGAEDYLVKGEVDDHILVRSVRYAVERSRRHRAERELKSTSEEFIVAQQVQKHLFPDAPPEFDGFDIDGAVLPASATAGDYFDYIPVDENRLALVLGDVSGHGMGPALMMAETRACLRTLIESHDDPGVILTHANRVLTGSSDETRFVTLAMAILDRRSKTLTYASAGQRGYLLRTSGEATVLDSTSLPLGIRKNLAVPVALSHVLRPGEIITFFTDGVGEAESPGLGRFTAERALDVILALSDRPAARIVEGLFESVDTFCRRAPRADDMTIVLAKVL
ncbi:MAG: SpoIIE family protein phosphatase [Planctomycetota bacterium]|nr:SpoIIE family protein phosphatase [Planctomycetota bacterium]